MNIIRYIAVAFIVCGASCLNAENSNGAVFQECNDAYYEWTDCRGLGDNVPSQDKIPVVGVYFVEIGYYVPTPSTGVQCHSNGMNTDSSASLSFAHHVAVSTVTMDEFLSKEKKSLESIGAIGVQAWAVRDVGYIDVSEVVMFDKRERIHWRIIRDEEGFLMTWASSKVRDWEVHGKELAKVLDRARVMTKRECQLFAGHSTVCVDKDGDAFVFCSRKKDADGYWSSSREYLLNKAKNQPAVRKPKVAEEKVDEHADSQPERIALPTRIEKVFGFKIGDILADRRNLGKGSGGTHWRTQTMKLAAPFAVCKNAVLFYTPKRYAFFRLEMRSDEIRVSSKAKIELRLREMADAVEKKYAHLLTMDRVGKSYVAKFKQGINQTLVITTEDIPLRNVKTIRIVIRFEDKDTLQKD